MIRYVVGIAFSEDFENVLLIEKKRPAWQEGRFNCPGGKFEPGETTAIQALSREFAEETGLIGPFEWRYLATKDHQEYMLEVLCATGPIHMARTVTDETVWVQRMSLLHQVPLVDELEWLIPLAEARLRDSCSAWRFH